MKCAGRGGYAKRVAGSLHCPNGRRWGMTRFLARRLLNYIVLLLLASFLTFCLTSVTFHPLDSFSQRHPQPPPAAIHAKAVQLGLDKPIPIRYGKWVSGVVRGDFGKTVSEHSVSADLWYRIATSA